MTYKSESDVMKVLEIDSWRNLSKDKVLQFVGLIPDIDREVALKIIGQFPEFRIFASDALSVLQEEYNSTLASNQESQAAVHRAFQEVRTILAEELKRDDLTPADRLVIIDKIMETANREWDKDSENKRFLDSMFGKAAATAAGVLLLGIGVLSGRALQNSNDKDGNESDLEA